MTQVKTENNILKEDLKNAKEEIVEKKNVGDALSATCDELKTKLCESEKLRRYLHNQVQDLKVSIAGFLSNTVIHRSTFYGRVFT